MNNLGNRNILNNLGTDSEDGKLFGLRLVHSGLSVCLCRETN